MNRFSSLLILIFISCSTDQLSLEGTLQGFIADRQVVLDNVIACAASNENDKGISVFLYPRDGVDNIHYFEAESSEIDKNDFSSYMEVNAPLSDIFNGYLKKFEVDATEEKWVIVSFDEGGKVHLSNPIRLKQFTKPTEYLPQNITVDATTITPDFLWKDGLYNDTKIYFQIVSDIEDNLISGTYTYDKMFSYYELQNVVLNITKGTPPALKNDTRYNFTLMGVSEDNWVNQFSVSNFTIGR